MTDTAPPPVHPKYLTAPVKSTKMPGGIPYIIGNEAAERFSYYGMKAILAIFIVDYLYLMNDAVGVRATNAEATKIVHLFGGAVYLTPLLGAFLSDSLLGKYRTIMWLSVVYCFGHAALAFMGVTGESRFWLFAGLGLIALGSGGIKPCVTAHVGDQFGKTNRHLMEKVFNFFYFSINFGSFLSTALTPVLLHHLGPHWAFGVPGVLMALATFMFWMGRHKFIHIPPGGVGFIKELFSKEGLAALGKLSVIYAFVAVFWALFDQTASSWVLQAKDMDRTLIITWLPSQIQALNPIMILIFIPIFTFFVYPSINRVFKLTPIRKISIGLFVMAAGFTIVSLAQERIDAGGTPSIAWQLLAYSIVTASEVMVSITCLEFSYTQAPKKMKSVVLAAFLCSVSAGNFFTAGVNHFIQSPSQSKTLELASKMIEEYREDEGELPPQDWSALRDEFESPGVRYERESNGRYTVRLPGFDAKFDTSDDVVSTYTATGKTASVETSGLASIRDAVSRIESYAEEFEQLPSQEKGEELLGNTTDQWGEKLVYRRINRLSARVTSPGPDKTLYTEHDLSIGVSIPDPLEESQDEEGPWLIERKKALGVTDGNEDSDPEDVATDEQLMIGGLVKLEGASYFWFFTQVMLGTAILFVVVGYFYRPKEYIHEEVEDIVAEGDLHG